jgi:hypothetical protein
MSDIMNRPYRRLSSLWNLEAVQLRSVNDRLTSFSEINPSFLSDNLAIRNTLCIITVEKPAKLGLPLYKQDGVFISESHELWFPYYIYRQYEWGASHEELHQRC